MIYLKPDVKFDKLTYHLVCQKQDSFQAELAVVVIKEIFKGGSKPIKDQSIVIALCSKSLNRRDINAIQTLVYLKFMLKLRWFCSSRLEFDTNFFLWNNDNLEPIHCFNLNLPPTLTMFTSHKCKWCSTLSSPSPDNVIEGIVEVEGALLPEEDMCSQLVICTGNPWVILAVPIPLPTKTHTRAVGTGNYHG